MRKVIWIAALVFLFSASAKAQVISQNTSVTFTCTGSTGPYPFTFPISDPTALTVIQNGTTLLSTAYTITPVNNQYENGGSVTLNTACPSAQILILQRKTPLTQTSIFTDNMPIPMKSFQYGLDKLTEIDQEIAEELANLTLSIPPPSLTTLGGVYAIDCSTLPGHIQKIETTGQPVCTPDSGGGGGSPGTPVQSFQFNSGGSFAGASGVTTPDGNSLIVKGPIPWRDATAYGAVSSTQTFTATCSSGSPNVTINTAGDWVNGQAISIEGCGATATVNAPNLTKVNITAISRTSNAVTATVSSCSTFSPGQGAPQFIQVAGYTGGHTAFNGVFSMATCSGTTATWTQVPSASDDTATTGTAQPGFAFYEGTNAGSTSHTYVVVSVGAGGGVSAKSADLVVTNDPATLTKLDFNWIYAGNTTGGGATGAPLGADFFCFYRDGSFLGRSYVPAFKDDGNTWIRNDMCPSSAPSSPTADVLVTTIVSGAGTTSLVTANNAITAGSGLKAFHDSAAAINAAAAASKADYTAAGSGSQPNVVLPYGQYYISRIFVSAYKLELTGYLNLTTHPILVGSYGSIQGHGANVVVAINYNLDDQVRINGNIEGVVFVGSTSAAAVRGLSFFGDTHDIVLAANDAGGSNGIVIDNISGAHNQFGGCIFAEANTIFVRVTNLKCLAATIANGGASENRYSMYFSDLWSSGSWVDWDMEDIFFDFGEIWMDSPVPSLLFQGGTQFREVTMKRFKGEGGLSAGMFNIDSECRNSPLGGNNPIVLSYPHFEDFGDSDRQPYKGFYYYPRIGSTGCTNPVVSDSSTIFANVQGADPLIGGDISYSGNDLSIGMDIGGGPADSRLGPLATRLGNRRSIFGEQLFTGYINVGGGDEVSRAYLMSPPRFFLSLNGAGGSCPASTTYYFKMSQSDGQGWTKVDSTSFESSISTGSGSQFIGLFFGTPFSVPPMLAPKYRIWYSTTEGVYTHYFETTNQGFYNFDCTAGTADTPPAFTTAYYAKTGSKTGDPNWNGTDPSDIFGFGKTNPAYSVDSSSYINSDLGFTAPKEAAPTCVSGRGFIWFDTTSSVWKFCNETGAPQVIGNTSGLYTYTGALSGIPGTCTVGQIAFITDATAGQNNYYCASTNVWTQQLNSGASGASTALGNLAAVAINTTLLPAAVNTVALGSTSLPFTHIFDGPSSSAYWTDNTSNLTGGRTVNIPDATSSPVRDCPVTTHQFLTVLAVATGICTKAQPILSDIAAGTAPSGTFDFSGVTLFKGRVGAGLTTSANGDFGYDTTNKNWHAWQNGGDEIVGVWDGTQVNGDCIKALIASSVVNLSDFGACATSSSTNTWTNKTENVEGIGNSLSVPIKAFFAAAGCNSGSTAGPAMATGASEAPTPQCVGSTVTKGVLTFLRGNVAYINWHLPPDWNSSASTDIELGLTSTDITNSDVVSFNIQTACNKVDGTATDDPSLNGLQALSITIGASQISGGALVGTKTGLTMTGCAADYDFEIAITRNNSGTDTAGNSTGYEAALKWAEITTGVTKNAANR